MFGTFALIFYVIADDGEFKSIIANCAFDFIFYIISTCQLLFVERVFVAIASIRSMLAQCTF